MRGSSLDDLVRAPDRVPPGRVAIVAGGAAHTYGELAAASERVAAGVAAGLAPGVAAGLAADAAARPPADVTPDSAPIALLAPPGFGFACALWGIWRAGGIAVPLALSHPPPELEHVLRDSGARAVVAAGGLAERVQPLCGADGPRLLELEALLGRPGGAAGAPRGAASAALLLYTSGTTGRPKGVLHTHASLAAQVRSLVEAWEWTAADRILHVLPLHHTHGLVNAFVCALSVGATCEMLPAFDAPAVWERLAAGEVTLFMAVPTVYVRLIAAWEAAPPAERARLSTGARRLRLMVSGSAPLPARVFERWSEITGHALLERYGMTEIGMALSNPLRGERRPGSVGLPLPGVEARRVDESGRPLAGEGEAGELEVRGPAVFREYWRRPQETRAAFRDGWFRTGDVAAVEGGRWRILGRASVDIVKTGGYKVSALEIEEVLRSHPAVADCAAVGVPDPEWGERVCAAVVAAGEDAPPADELTEWAKQRLAPYKVPRRWTFVPGLPRNALGKVDKIRVRSLFG